MIITNKEKEEVLIKIEKLMAHTKIGTNGAVNINEMAVANKLIKELMDKYSITIDEIKNTSDKSTLVNKVVGNIFKGQSEQWAWRLSSIVSEFYDCRCIRVREKLYFIGFDIDAKVALKMYSYLFIQINKASYGATETPSFIDKKVRRLDFCMGAIHSLDERLKEIKSEREKQETTTALVVVKKDVVDDQTNKLFPKLKSSNNTIKYHITEDFMNGVVFGKKVKLQESELITK